MKQQGWKEAQKRRVRREEVREEEERKTEGQGARKSRKVAKHCVFPMFCGPEGSKSRLTKAAGAQASREMRPEKLHTVVARGSQTLKTFRVRSTFGS